MRTNGFRRPSAANRARAVVHHIIVFRGKVRVKTRGFMCENTADGIGDGFLTAYAPGELSCALPLGSAKLIPEEFDSRSSSRTTRPTALRQTDRCLPVGLIFAKEPPED